MSAEHGNVKARCRCCWCTPVPRRSCRSRRTVLMSGRYTASSCFLLFPEERHPAKTVAPRNRVVLDASCGKREYCSCDAKSDLVGFTVFFRKQRGEDFNQSAGIWSSATSILRPHFPDLGQGSELLPVAVEVFRRKPGKKRRLQCRPFAVDDGKPRGVA